MKKLDEVDPPLITNVAVTRDGLTFELYEGRKWKSGRFDRNIGIDQPTSGAGQTHAHVYGRNNKQELVVVNFDGTPSHGMKGKLSAEDAGALRKLGFQIPASNLIEWVVVKEPPQLLFG